MLLTHHAFNASCLHCFPLHASCFKAGPRPLTPVRASNGAVVWQCHKGPFCLVQGQLDEDTLQWLRADEAFVAGAGGLEASFSASDAAQMDRKYEAGSKVEIAGHCISQRLDKNVAGARINGMSASRPFPARLLKFVGAFKHINKERFQELQSLLQAGIEKIPPEETLENNGCILGFLNEGKGAQGGF